jgi:hypothetical protein
MVLTDRCENHLETGLSTFKKWNSFQLIRFSGLSRMICTPVVGAIQLSISSTAMPISAMVLEHGPIATGLLICSTLLVCMLIWISVPKGSDATFSLAEH